MGRNVMIITGTSRGLGKFLAEYYLKNDFFVLGVSRTESSIKHKRYSHFLADVSEERSVMEFLFEINKKGISPDILINNAGIASMNHVILTPVHTAEKIFKVNFLGTFIMSREIAKCMIRKRWGRIVNISTVAVPLKLEGEAVYASSKSAVEMFTQILARELISYGITCNCVGPAPIPTDLLKSLPAEKIDHLVQKLVIKKCGECEDVAHTIEFFISQKSGNITGQTIYLGGM